MTGSITALRASATFRYFTMWKNEMTLLTGRKLNGNFDLLRAVIAEGRADSDIVETFPQARLTRPENFLSLMHYFGLLSIRDVTAGVPRLGIPNQTVRRLMYGYLRDAYNDVGERTGGGRRG